LKKRPEYDSMAGHAILW